MNRPYDTFSSPVKTIAATLALAALALACSDESPTARGIEMPNIVALWPEVANESNVYSFAYGVGLTAGCNPDKLLDKNGDLIFIDDKAQQAYKDARQRDPEDFDRGALRQAWSGVLQKLKTRIQKFAEKKIVLT